MRVLAITAFYILIFINSILSESIDKSDEYPNKLVLKKPDLYYVYWKANSENITFEVHVKDSKWLLFGVSNDDYSDVMVAWLNDDLIGHFSDRKIVDKNDDFDLTTDENLDWIPLDLYKEDNYTIAKFYRSIKVECGRDTNDDVDINPGKMTVVFSDGDDVKYDDDSIDLRTLSEVKVDLLGETQGPFECKTETQNIETKSFDSEPTSNYVNVVDFIDGVYRMYWNFTETDIVAEIHVKTTGWVGFGFSPNGGMNGSDVVIGWIKNGVANFTDRFIIGRTVKIDKNQNWQLLKYAETNGFTIFKFKRDIALCDPEDLTIDKGSPNIIFAYGETDPADGGDIYYHSSNRGTKKLNIINRNKIQDIAEPDTEIYDFELKHVILPKTDTIYLCKMFQVPLNLIDKRHIYKTELILPKRNFGKFHHIDADECTTNFEKSLPAFDCFKHFEDVKGCTVQGFAWSVGGDLVHLYPKDAGYPIGGDTEYKSFHLVIHYNNPTLDIGYIENFKFRHYVTKNLREKELGFLTVGTASNGYGIAIPPQVDNFNIYGYCDNNCLSQRLKDGDITVISANPHTHLTGVEVSTKILRNGVDIGYLHRNQNYDFNFQDMYMLNPPINITKNDELITKCTYRTMGKSTFTIGGYTTHDEMCMTFFLYYPRIKGFNICGSAPTIQGYSEFLNELNKDGEIDIKPISNFTLSVLFETLDTTFKQLKNKTITNNLRNKFIKFFDETNFSTSCDMNRNSNDTTQLKGAFIEKNECKSNYRFY